MKNILTPLGFLLCFSLDAQIEFLKWYGTPNRNETLIGIERGTDDNTYWAAGTIANNNQNDFWITRMDSLGHLQWQDTLGVSDKNEQLSDIAYNPLTGHIWLAGESRTFKNFNDVSFIFLQKLDASGQLIWEKTAVFNFYEYGTKFQHTRLRPLDIEAAGDGILLYQPDEGRLARLDAEGNIVWTRDFQHAIHTSSNMMTATADGGCVLLENSSTGSAVVHRIGTDGATLWSQPVPDDFPGSAGDFQGISSAVDASDGSVYVVAEGAGGWLCAFYKFSATGELVWETLMANAVKPLDFTKGFILQIPQNQQVAFVYRNNMEVLDSQTGAVSQPIVLGGVPAGNEPYLNDGVMVSGGKLLCAGVAETRPDAYDDWTVLVAVDDFSILESTVYGFSEISGTDSYTEFAVSPDGGYWLGYRFENDFDTGDGIMLHKTDAEGNTLWQKPFFSSYGNDVTNFKIATLDDGTACLAYSADSLYILKIDNTGNALWLHKIKARWNTNITIAPAPGSAVVAIYNVNLGPQDDYATEATGFGSNGGQLWQKVWHHAMDFPQNTIYAASQFPDGTVVGVGSKDGYLGYYMRFDPTDGTILVDKGIVPADPPSKGLFSQLAITPDSNVLMLAMVYSDPSVKSPVFCIVSPDGEIQAEAGGVVDMMSNAEIAPIGVDLNGDYLISHIETESGVGTLSTVWRSKNIFDEVIKTTPDLPPYFYSDAHQLPDGSVLLSGHWTPTNSVDAFFMKVKVEGLVAAHTPKDIFSALEVLPNPLARKQSLQLILDNNWLGSVQIECYTPDGALVFCEESKKTAVREILTLDRLPDLPAFYVRVRCGMGVVGKMVVRE